MADSSLDQYQLDPSELRLVGGSYGSSFTPQLLIQGARVQLVAATNTGRAISRQTALLLVIAVAFLTSLAYLASTGTIDWSMFYIALVPSAIGVFGPALAYSIQREHEEYVNPFLDIDLTAQTASVLAGRYRFPLDCVFALLAVSIRRDDGEVVSELQLLVEESNRLKPYLIRTSGSSSARATFGHILEEFGRSTGIRTLLAEPAGFLKRGPLVMTDVTTGVE